MASRAKHRKSSDLQFFGHSFPRIGAYRPEHYGSQPEVFRERQQLERIHRVGHSCFFRPRLAAPNADKRLLHVNAAPLRDPGLASAGNPGNRSCEGAVNLAGSSFLLGFLQSPPEIWE